MIEFIEQYALWIGLGIAALAIWELVWKGFAMWRAARNEQKAWFWCLLIFNTLGLLPIFYLLFFSQK